MIVRPECQDMAGPGKGSGNQMVPNTAVQGGQIRWHVRPRPNLPAK